MYKYGGKCIQILFKEYQDSLPEDKGTIGFATFHDIVKLLKMRGESKSGLSKYFIKLCHGKNVFDHILDRIVQWSLNGISSINSIGFSKSLKKKNPQ